MKKRKFNWGSDTSGFRSIVEDEIFKDNCYEAVYPVKEGDVVLDIGASLGPFTWNVADRASKVVALEPSAKCLPLLEENTKDFLNVFVEPQALGKWDGNLNVDKLGDFEKGNNYHSNDVPCITLKSLCKKYALDKIDFIKTDCEGGEYNLFTDENMPFLLNKVRNIVGEFHMNEHDCVNGKVEFRYFRDKYLKQFPNYKIYSVDNKDITWQLFKDTKHNSWVKQGNGEYKLSPVPPFIERYRQVIVHISNDA